MSLWHQVQYLEQRVLMLEQFVRELTLHVAAQGLRGYPHYQQPVYAPPVRRSAMPSPVLSSHAVAPERADFDMPAIVDPDFASLADSLVGAQETEVDMGVDAAAYGDFGANDALGEVGGAAADAAGEGDAGGGAAGDGGADGGDF